jgi:hypothetical protein
MAVQEVCERRDEDQGADGPMRETSRRTEWLRRDCLFAEHWMRQAH